MPRSSAQELCSVPLGSLSVPQDDGISIKVSVCCLQSLNVFLPSTLSQASFVTRPTQLKPQNSMNQILPSLEASPAIKPYRHHPRSVGSLSESQQKQTGSNSQESQMCRCACVLSILPLRRECGAGFGKAHTALGFLASCEGALWASQPGP